MSVRLNGSCLCGTVRYRVDDEFVYALICHCSQCRRATGSAFKPFGGIQKEKLALIAGDEAVMRYGGEVAHDVHCGKCGSLLYSWFRDSPYVHVTYGTPGGRAHAQTQRTHLRGVEGVLGRNPGRSAAAPGASRS